MRAMRTIFGLLLCLSLGSCSKDQPASKGPGPGDGSVACTTLGCINGLQISLEKATAWAPGKYSFVFDLDGTAVTCKGELPLKNCEAGPSLTCDPAGKVQIGESGCALAPEAQGFADIQIGGSPRAVAITVLKDDQPLQEVKLTPTYAESRPNGEGCEPVCNGASERVALP